MDVFMDLFWGDALLSGQHALHTRHCAYRSCSSWAEPTWPLPAMPLLEHTALLEQLLLETKPEKWEQKG